jgi:hypothetical protein
MSRRHRYSGSALDPRLAIGLTRCGHAPPFPLRPSLFDNENEWKSSRRIGNKAAEHIPPDNILEGLQLLSDRQNLTFIALRCP